MPLAKMPRSRVRPSPSAVLVSAWPSEGPGEPQQGRPSRSVRPPRRDGLQRGLSRVPFALDPARVGRAAGRIAEEVIAHLGAEPGAQATVTQEIDTRSSGAASEQTVRFVNESSRTLKFVSHGFVAT